jgi:hypothetical protein
MPTSTCTDPSARCYRLRVIDSCVPALAGHDGAAYTVELAHCEDDALTLARLLLGFPVDLADGPWRCAIPAVNAPSGSSPSHPAPVDDRSR